MNKVILTGFIANEVDAKFTQTGKAVTKFSIAVKRAYADKTDFLDIETWNKTAEFCGNYLKKGSRVLVEGELHKEQYEKDGVKKYVYKIVADRVEGLDRKEKQQDNGFAAMGKDVTDDEVLPF